MLELRAEHLIKTYKKRTVVNDVSFNVKQGEIVGLLGPNGAGKTTSFYMIVGLIKPNSGKIFLQNEEILSRMLKILYGCAWEIRFLKSLKSPLMVI